MATNNDFNEEDFYKPEEFVEDLEFIQANSLSELRTKILKKLEDGGTIEQNPFWDPQSNKWTQMVLYYVYDEDEEE